MAVVYPFNREANNLNFTKGNFGLWFNKYIPVNDKEFCKVCNKSGDTNEAVKFYHEKYQEIKNHVTNELAKRHKLQKEFLECMKSHYIIIELHAKLISPLITGVGYQHPSETSILFDHNLGIPYIPASTIKGIVRFAFTLGILDDEMYSDDKYYGEDKYKRKYLREDLTPIGQAFGFSLENNSSRTQRSNEIMAQRGSVIFLDAYPENVPDLMIDILNPHYPDYYGKSSFPSDDQNPLPIKFLTVSKETVFIFRAIVKKSNKELLDLVIKSLKNALCEEGVGAKTAIGYGRFIIQDQDNETKDKNDNVNIDNNTKNVAIDIIPGKEYDVKVEGVTPDGGSVKVAFLNGKKAIISKKKFPKEIQNNIKKFCNSGVVLKVKVLSYQSGNINLELINIPPLRLR